jgi:hypothetical protein
VREFEVTVTEMLKKKVVIEAETAEKAEIEVTERWYDGDYIIDGKNFAGVTFEVKEVQREPERGCEHER